MGQELYSTWTWVMRQKLFKACGGCARSLLVQHFRLSNASPDGLRKLCMICEGRKTGRATDPLFHSDETMQTLWDKAAAMRASVQPSIKPPAPLPPMRRVMREPSRPWPTMPQERFALIQAQDYAVRVRSTVRAALFGAGPERKSRAEALLGCSAQEFRKMIERQFLPGMSWDNAWMWHLDHIGPLATAKTMDDVRSLSHCSNIRPIWAADNLAKRDKRLFLI